MAVSITPVIQNILLNDSALLKGALTAVPLFLKLWPLYLIMAIVIVAKAAYNIHHYYILSRAGMSEIDKMNDRDFELFLTGLFSRLGYKAEHVGHTGDYGVDVIAEIDGRRIVVQAKHYGYKHKVGEDAVREAYSGMNMYTCTKAIVATNSFFTPMAKSLAKSDNVELWDRYALAKAILLSRKSN